MDFMYYDPHKTFLGTTNGLHNYYFYLNWLLRVTFAPKSGYATKIIGLSLGIYLQDSSRMQPTFVSWTSLSMKSTHVQWTLGGNFLMLLIL